MTSIVNRVVVPRRTAGVDGDREKAKRLGEEPTTVVVAELVRANEQLQQLNQTLIERNTELERVNADLNCRMAKEVAARETAQRELFQLQKLEAVGQLTGGIAHDFNNLLTVVINGLQLLGRVTDPEQRKRVLRRTEEAAWRGASLTSRLLAFARRQPLDPDRIDLPVHIDNLRELLVHSLREDIAVRTELQRDLWPVEADIGALELALLNLAVNARDAMSRGGTLTIRFQNRRLGRTEAAPRGVEAGDFVEIAVLDTGSGIPEALLGKVFEPFFTTKTGKGTGLGLAQVFGFARQSGGTVWIESEADQGTSVFLLLPRSHRPARREKTLTSPAKLPARRAKDRLSILVVEDNDEVASIVLDMLSQLGHRGTRVGTVASALAILTGTEEVHLVFSDVVLPGGDSGLDLAREMTRRDLQVPLILTTGHGGSITGTMAAASLPYLRKPYRMDALRRAIENAVERHATVSLAGNRAS
ncbi:MAG: response regulator [Acetobacteraceae bacterium]|nr:response regulator [Acetobacteraceae bacterium]